MKNCRRKTVILGLCALTMTPTAVIANTNQSHASIREAARQHVLDTAAAGDNSQIRIGDLDRRLKLAACDQPLESYDSPNGLQGGRGVVGVRCDGTKPWKIYVPVRVAIMESVVVSRRPIVRGQALRAEDLQLKETDVSRVHKAYYTRIEDLIGMRAKRSIKPGKPLYANVLKREKMIKRGSQIEIIANSGGLKVRMQGKALADGGHGDRIKVKNLNSGRVITGLVTAPGVIQVSH